MKLFVLPFNSVNFGFKNFKTLLLRAQIFVDVTISDEQISYPETLLYFNLVQNSILFNLKIHCKFIMLIYFSNLLVSIGLDLYV